jgi:uncharacterized protein involved in outer membrane biogenesis
MAGKRKRYFLITVLLVLALLAVVGFGLVPVNLFFIKAPVSQAIQDELGLELEINGPLRIRFGARPVLTVVDIRLSHPGRGERPLATAGKLEIKPRLRALFRGQFHFRTLQGSAIGFDYCQPWPPAPGDTESGDTRGPPPSLVIDKVQFTGIEPGCSNPENASPLVPESLDLTASAPLDGALEASISGRNGSDIWQLQLGGESLDKLLGNPPRYPFNVDLSAPGFHLASAGEILNPLSEPEISARVELDARQPERVLAAFGIETPRLGALQASANLEAGGDFVQVENLAGALGKQEFFLSGTVRGFSTRPVIELDIRAEQVDLEQLPGMVSADPGTQTKPESEFGPQSESTDYDSVFELLADFDAQATIWIGRVLNAPLPLEYLAIEASLADHAIDLEISELLLAKNPLTATAKLDMRPACARLTSRIQVSQLDLGKLKPLLDQEVRLGGTLGKTSITSSSCGSSLAQHRESIEAVVSGEALKLSWNGEDSPLEIAAFDSTISWNDPGRLMVTGDWRDYPLSLEIGFGSIHAVYSGLSWPLSFDLAAGDSILRLQGIAALGKEWVELDTHILAQLGRSDLQGSISGSIPGRDSPLVIDLESRTLDYAEINTYLEGLDSQRADESTDWMELLTESEWLEDLLDLPDVDLDLLVRNFRGPRFNASDAMLLARIRHRQIEDGRLSMKLGQVDIDGSLDMDLRKRPWTLNFVSALDNIDVGYLLDRLSLAEDIIARADHAELRLSSEGSNLKQLIINSRFETQVDGFHWAFSFGPDQPQHEADLSSLSLNIAPSSPVTWQFSGKLNDVPIKAWMRTPSIQSTFDRSTDIPVTLAMAADDDVAMFKAFIKRKNPDDLWIDLSVSGEYMDSQYLDFSELEAPLEAYEFRTDINIRENEVVLSNLNARIGSSHAEGEIRVELKDSVNYFDFDIHAPFLETEDLVLWAEDWRKSTQKLSGGLERERPDEKVEGDVLTAIIQTIEQLTQSNRYDVRISIDELRSGGKLLGAAQVGLSVDGNEFRLDPASIQLPGGVVEASYYGLRVGDGFESGLDMSVEGLEYGGLLRLFDPESKGHGKLYLETSLFSQSPGPAEVFEHLGGTLDIAVFPEDVEAAFLDLWASNLVFALLPLGEDSRKKMNCMVGLFEVENGIMSTKTTFLDSTDVIVRARGDIDLVRRELDLLVAPQSKIERFFSVSAPIEVSGPFSDFKVEMAPGGFVTTMIRWYYGLIYVPWKWLTGERFPADGIETCHNAMGWETP